ERPRRVLSLPYGSVATRLLGLPQVRRRFFLTQRPTQFRQGDILELTDSLSRNPKLLTDFFEGLRFATIQSEPLEDYLALPVVEDLKQVAHLEVQVFVSEQLERRLSIFIPNNFTKFSRIVIADWGVQRSGPNRDRL